MPAKKKTDAPARPLPNPNDPEGAQFESPRLQKRHAAKAKRNAGK